METMKKKVKILADLCGIQINSSIHFFYNRLYLVSKIRSWQVQTVYKDLWDMGAKQ